MTNPEALAVAPAGSNRWRRADTAVALGLVVAGILLALALGSDYGMSWDERDTAVYGQQTLDSYARQRAPRVFFKNSNFYGPLALAAAEAGAPLLASSLPAWSLADGRHAMYALSLTLATLSVFLIGRGLAGRWAGLAAALLFATQPLIFGHAFINPKDAPFMGLFAAAMAGGVLSIRALPSRAWRIPLLNPPEVRALHTWRTQAGHRWTAFPESLRVVLVLILGVGLIGLLDVLLTRQIVLPSLLGLTQSVYDGSGPPALEGLFLRLAQSGRALPVDDYLTKVAGLHQNFARGLVRLLIGGAVVSACALLFLQLRRLGLGVLVGFVLAGVLLGMAGAVRVVAPLAGVLISGLLIVRVRWRSVSFLLLYWGVAAAVTYVAWPFLWPAPIEGFLESLALMTQFPWNHPVLFAGTTVLAASLPWYYPPAILSLQLTLPALVFGLAGGVGGLLPGFPSANRLEALACCVWLVFPMAYGGLRHATLYDNARQLLFILPALFILSAVAFAWVFRRVGKPGWGAAIAALVILPGVLSILRLHPYEYIYFNETVGGTAGASRRFELDYWATGYREAMEQLSQVAPQDASIGVVGPWQAAWAFARPDMRRWTPTADAARDRPDFLVVTTRTNRDLDSDHWPQAPTLLVVERGGAPLVIVRDLRQLP